MTEPRVSVIIPTYNRAALIKKSIQSVLDQSFSDFELIVVDDASTDDTELIVSRVPDSRIRYIKLHENCGGSAARNAGIRNARAELLAFQDSDDEWMPDKLLKQVATMDTAGRVVGVVYSGFWQNAGRRRWYFPDASIKNKDGQIFSQLLLGNFISTQTVVARKEYLSQVGLFDESLPRLQDWDLFLRLAKICEFRCIDEALVNVYYTPDSISSKNHSLLESLKIIFSKFSKDFAADKDALSKIQFVFANTYRRERDLRNCRAALKQAVKARPRLIFLMALASSYGGLKFNDLFFKLLLGAIDKKNALSIRLNALN